MFQEGLYSHTFLTGCRRSSVALAAYFLFNGVAAAQDLASTAPRPGLSMPDPIGMPLRVAFPLISSIKTNDGIPLVISLDGKGSAPAFAQILGDTPAGVRRITLEQAQQLAAAANDPLVRLGELQVEAAKQHRLSTRSLYFPNVSTQFENLHFNKALGELLSVRRPLAGETISVPVNIIEQNQTAVNFAVVQPITPLFAVRELVTIARADENIARAKAGMPVAVTASTVEKTYYDLLIAERELVSAVAEAKKVQAKWVTVSNTAAVISNSPEEQRDAIGAGKSLVLAASKVKELTASLDDMLGLPEKTRLELVPPHPLVENLSLNQAIAQAQGISPEVIEAEQTAVKARAGSMLAKMAYFPSVAVFGGYTHQNALNVILPEDFSYVGFMATYTIFDSGKRERDVNERRAQVDAAELGVQLTKAKAAAAVKTAFFELERSREVATFVRRIVSTPMVQTTYLSDNQEGESARAKTEADMFRAELEYRQAYARVKSLMGDK